MKKDGYYYIQGRLSVDIIKSGGYKISALEIEKVLLEHPGVAETSVLGLKDQTFGQKIAAVLVRKNSQEGNELEEKILVAWLKERLASYKIPRSFHFVHEIPKNPMGKVNKKTLPSLLGLS